MKILRGRRVNRDIRVYIVPATRKVYTDALEKGIIKSLVESGCDVMSPGCGSCLELHRSYLEPGDKLFSTAECGLSGSHDTADSVYLGSTAAAAATAIEGVITDPRKYLK
jgi:3-isopropylmalate/(R)-2-methylmalate dehydratase large subunit